MKINHQPIVLIILDGWGYREDRDANAILLANTPNWHRIWAHESRTLLTASGHAVGLPNHTTIQQFNNPTIQLIS